MVPNSKEPPLDEPAFAARTVAVPEFESVAAEDVCDCEEDDAAMIVVVEDCVSWVILQPGLVPWTLLFELLLHDPLLLFCDEELEFIDGVSFSLSTTQPLELAARGAARCNALTTPRPVANQNRQTKR